MNKENFFLFSLAAFAVPLGLAAVSFGSPAPAPARGAAQTDPGTQAVQSAPTHAALLPSPAASGVVEAANAFLSTLSARQRTVAEIALTHPLAAKWSNFPTTFVARNGVFLQDMNAKQAAAALTLARLALGAEGFHRFQEIRASDDLLHQLASRNPGGPRGGLGGPGGPGDGPDGNDPGGFGGPPQDGGSGPGGPGGPGGGPGNRVPGGDYGGGTYTFAFLGKPSKTTPWLLQIGGPHLAFNLLYRGASGAATPYFLGTEPTAWKDADGKAHAPLAPMHDAVYGLIDSLTADQRSQAHLSASFHDVLVGPGQDGRFPDLREGVPVAGLSAASRTFVKKAIIAWTGDNAQAAAYQKRYFDELEQTKVAYSGTATLNQRGDYVRIDGPHVWIEFSCQGGIVVHNQIHYHTIWRDRATDYGAEFSR